VSSRRFLFVVGARRERRAQARDAADSLVARLGADPAADKAFRTAETQRRAARSSSIPDSTTDLDWARRRKSANG
jgi:hypothetical protein